MDILTRIFGKITINADQVLQFAEGLPGFEMLRRFTLVDLEQTRPFIWLQSLEQDVALPLISPFMIQPDYSPDIDDAALAQLDLVSEEDLMVYAVVVIPPDVTRMTANLAAPVLINMKTTRAAKSSSKMTATQSASRFTAVFNGPKEDSDHARGDP